MDSYKEMRDRLVTEMMRTNNENRELLEKVRGESRDFTSEEFQEFTRRNDALDTLEERVRQIDKANASTATIDGFGEQAERHIRPTGDPADPTSNIDQRALDFFQGKTEAREFFLPLRGISVQRDERTGRNYAVESRTGLTSLSNAAGGFVVPQSFRAVLYQHLILNSAIRQTRATVMTTDSGEPIVMPKTLTHSADGTIVAQAAAIGEQDPTFGQGTLSAYKFANIIQVSTELEQDTGVDLLGYIAMQAGRALANGSGKKFITGTGTSEPAGVLTGAGTVAQVTGATGISGIPTYKELEDRKSVV